jgi:hypothetical protein
MYDCEQSEKRFSFLICSLPFFFQPIYCFEKQREKEKVKLCSTQGLSVRKDGQRVFRPIPLAIGGSSCCPDHSLPGHNFSLLQFCPQVKIARLGWLLLPNFSGYLFMGHGQCYKSGEIGQDYLSSKNHLGNLTETACPAGFNRL